MISPKNVLSFLLYPIQSGVPINAGERSLYLKFACATTAVGLAGGAYLANRLERVPPPPEGGPVHVDRTEIGYYAGTAVSYLTTADAITKGALTALGVLPRVPWVGLACTAAGLGMMALGRVADFFITQRQLSKIIENEEQGTSSLAERVAWTKHTLGGRDAQWWFGQVRNVGGQMLACYVAFLAYQSLD